MDFSKEEIVALKAAKTQTLVFWDLVECPIPEGMDVVTVSGNIRDALKKEGYQGQTVIRSFGDTSQYSPDAFSKALVELVHLPKRELFELSLSFTYMCVCVLTCVYCFTGDEEGDEEARRQMILAHLLCGAVDHLAPLNLMLIMGDLSELLQVCSAFLLLRWSHYNCMLVQPQDSPMLYEDSVTTAWLWDTLSSGGKPLRSVSLVDDTSVSTSSSQGHPEFLHCFKSLKERRNINVLLAQPHRENVSKELLSSVEAVWLWSSLSRGDLPIDEEDQGSEYASTDSEA